MSISLTLENKFVYKFNIRFNTKELNKYTIVEARPVVMRPMFARLRFTPRVQYIRTDNEAVDVISKIPMLADEELENLCNLI